MSEASAVPEKLYSYSDQCTRGAEALQNWVQRVLAPAINAYEQGGGPCFVPITPKVATAVSEAYYTDRDVRNVARAFQQAGSAGPMPGLPFGPSAHDLPGRQAIALYTMKDSVLDAQIQHQSQIDAGAALASKMTTKGDPDNLKWISQALSEHADDPFFCAGFYNRLTAEQIVELMGRRGDSTVHGNDDALASALASGLVTKETARDILKALSWVQTGNAFDPTHWHITADTQLSVLRTLAANPAAARNFVDALSVEDVRRFINLSRGVDGAVYSQVFSVLTSAALTHGNDPAGMTALMNKVSTAMTGMDISHIPHSGAVLLQFVRLGIAGSITEPGDNLTQEQINRWASQQGDRVDAMLAPYLKMIKGSNDARENYDALVRGLLEGEVLALLPWGKVIKTGSAIIDNIVITGIQGWLTPTYVDPAAKKVLQGDNGQIKLVDFAKDAAGGAGTVAIWMQLAKHGYVFDSYGNKVGVDSNGNLTGGRGHLPGLSQSPLAVKDMLAHPEDYKVRTRDDDGHGYDETSLPSVTNNYGGRMSFANPNSKSIAALE